ncbi:MAG: NAD-dependent epimerase/dehydratase family protein [bacterium]
MKALVTGGGGFLGNAIVRQLRERGDEVRTFSRTGYPLLEELGVDQVQGNLTDQEAVKQAVEGCDTVFHAAAKVGSWGAYEDFYSVNVAGTENVINACRKSNVHYLVYTSTPSVVFGKSDLEGVNESIKYPDYYEAFYPQTKAAAERLVIAANTNSLKTVTLRPHVIWGPGDTSLLPRVLERGRRGRLRRIRGPKKMTDITYIDDAACAHLLAADKLRSSSDSPGQIAGKAYFISSGQPVEIWDFVNRLLKAATIPPVTKSVPLRLALAIGWMFETLYAFFGIKSEPHMTRWVVRELATSHWFDISAARRDLGYKPTVTLEEGLHRLESWLQNRSL